MTLVNFVPGVNAWHMSISQACISQLKWITMFMHRPGAMQPLSSQVYLKTYKHQALKMHKYQRYVSS